MANLTNLNNKFLVTTGGAVLINQTAVVSTHLLTVDGRIGGPTFSDSYLQFTGGNVLLKANDDIKLGYNQNVIVKQSGNVGIGTNSPTRKLQIVNTDDTRGILVENTLSTSYAEVQVKASREFRIGTGNSSSATEARDRFYVYDATASAHRFTIDSSGNVGIGITSPLGKLMVQDDTGGSPTRIIVSNGGTAQSGTAARLSFYEGTSEKNYIERRRDGSGDFAFVSPADDNPFVFENASGEFLTLVNSNVGIGTSSPGAKLHNYSTATSNVFISGYGTSAQNDWGASHAFFIPDTNGVLISKSNAANNTNRLYSFYNDASGNAEQYIYNTSNTATIKLDSAGDSYLNGGDVGIGTTSPDTLLNLEGGADTSIITLGCTKNDASWSGERIGGINFYSADGSGPGASVRGSINYIATSTSGGSTAMTFKVGDNSEFMRIANGGTVYIMGATPSVNNSLQFSYNSTAGSAEIYAKSTGGNTHFEFYTSDAGTTSEKLRIKNDGKVGIGTTSPNSILHLSSSGPTELTLSDTNAASNTKNYGMFCDTGKLHIRRLTDAYSGYTPTMTFDQDKVGINKSGPTYFLDVIGTNEDMVKLHNSTDGLDSLISFTNPGGTLGRIQGLDNGGLQFDTGNNAGGLNTNVIYMSNDGRVGINTDSPDEKLDITGGFLKFNGGDYGLKGSASLAYNAVSDHYFQSNGSTKVIFKASGNVGIGLTNPDSKLYVKDSHIKVEGNATDTVFFEGVKTGTGVTTKIYNNSNGTYWDSYAHSVFRANQLGGSGGSMVFMVPNEAMRINSNSDVGIGTSSPGYKLEVNGSIAMTDYMYHVGDADTYFGFNSADSINFVTNNVSRLYMDNNGFGSQTRWGNQSTPDTTHTSFADVTNTIKGVGVKYLGQFNIRDGSRYLDIVLNSTADNVMFYIMVRGYLYNRGSYWGWASGYTYQSGIINKSNNNIMSAGTTKTIDTYRGTNGTGGNYSGNLCIRFDSGANSYSEGYVEVYVGSHTVSWQSGIDATAYAQNDESTDYFAQ